MKTSFKMFVYGSLMSPEVLQALLGRVPTSLRAVLPGYHRYKIKGQVFPAVKSLTDGFERSPDFSHVVDGLVLIDLREDEVKLFDEFEDEGYKRIEVTLEVNEGREERANFKPRREAAEVYVWNSNAYELFGTWSYEKDFLPHLKSYVKMCEEFRQEYNSGRTS